jgi:hypothetical protein
MMSNENNTVNSTAEFDPALAVLKAKLGAAWMDGDYAAYYPSWSYPFDAGKVVEYFRTAYGPVKRAFGSLDRAGQQSLRAELEAVFSTHSGTKNGTTELRAEYLDVSAIRR